MIKIAICEDENVIINQIEQILREVCKSESIDFDIDVFYCGNTLVKEVESGTKYDLLYLDIQMEGGDGISAAKNIRQTDENVVLIYVSSFDKHMIELFRLDVFTFIKKPIEQNYFSRIFLEAVQKISNKKSFYIYKYKNQEHKILCSQILFFGSEGRQVHIHMRNGENCFFNGKLNDVECFLKNGKTPFLRIHQSYLVNYFQIRSHTKLSITLVNDKKLYISEDRQKDFKGNYS